MAGRQGPCAVPGRAGSQAPRLAGDCAPRLARGGSRAPWLTGGRVPRLGEGSHASRLVGLAVERLVRKWSRARGVGVFFRNGRADNEEGRWASNACGSGQSEASRSTYVLILKHVFLRSRRYGPVKKKNATTGYMLAKVDYVSPNF